MRLGTSWRGLQLQKIAHVECYQSWLCSKTHHGGDQDYQPSIRASDVKTCITYSLHPPAHPARAQLQHPSSHCYGWVCDLRCKLQNSGARMLGWPGIQHALLNPILTALRHRLRFY